MEGSKMTRNTKTKDLTHTYKSKISYISPSKIVVPERSARTHSDKQIRQIANSIETYGFTNPILIDQSNKILAGSGRVKAALLLKLNTVPVVMLSHLTSTQRKAYILADNKLAEKAGWDFNILKLEFEDLIEMDTEFDLSLTGFDTPEIDFIVHQDLISQDQDEPPLPEPLNIEKRVESGDLWQLDKHYLYCGDSLQKENYEILFFDDAKAKMCFIDPPYNVPISGHVCNKGKTQHDEFAFASGEMSTSEFQTFLKTSLFLAAEQSQSGSLHYICMDWRHVNDLLNATHDIYDDLKNICVWNKQTAGMGSLYRSQHEFVCVFKKAGDSHTNNVELGKHGRYRTNVWDYSGVHATSHRRNDIKLHPTVKPTLMIADAILDCTKPKDLVFDCFGGSGSTLLAAEFVNRTARLIEYDPKYCDVTLQRFEDVTGIKPVRLERAAS